MRQQAYIWDRDGTAASVAYIAPHTRDSDAWREYNAAMIFELHVLKRTCTMHGMATTNNEDAPNTNITMCGACNARLRELGR